MTRKNHRHASLLSKTSVTHFTVVTCGLVSVMCVDLCACVSSQRAQRREHHVEVYRNRQNRVCVCVQALWVYRVRGCLKKVFRDSKYLKVDKCVFFFNNQTYPIHSKLGKPIFLQRHLVFINIQSLISRLSGTTSLPLAASLGQKEMSHGNLSSIWVRANFSHNSINVALNGGIQ